MLATAFGHEIRPEFGELLHTRMARNVAAFNPLFGWRDAQPLAQHFTYTVLAQIEADCVAVTKHRVETAGVIKRQPFLPVARFIGDQATLAAVTGTHGQLLDGSGSVFAHNRPDGDT